MVNVDLKQNEFFFFLKRLYKKYFGFLLKLLLALIVTVVGYTKLTTYIQPKNVDHLFVHNNC